LRKALGHLASLWEILVEFHWNRGGREGCEKAITASQSVTPVQAVPHCKQSENTGKSHIISKGLQI